MSSNKRAKELLIKRYGEQDFLDALHIVMPKSKTYKSKGQRKRMQQLTFHHIREKSKGGKATIENGALLTAENHATFHKLPREEQDKLNQMFQDYKKSKDKELPVVFEDFETGIEIKVAEIEIDRQGYCRAKVKEETRKLIEEDIQEYYR